jgi:glycosyltransferase involved in cell wall biosynthesis
MARFALEPPLRAFPLVFDLVDVDSEKWRSLSETAVAPARWVYASEARRLSTFEARAAACAEAVLVVNDRERAAILRLAPGANVCVVPNGVAIDELRPTGPPSEDFRVVFCGVMNYRPNEDAALWFARAVWPAIRERCPQARFSLVGSDPTQALRHLAVADPTIEVTGAVEDVRPYLWRGAVAIAPLFVARGVQNKVLEAVAAGLPCVVTPAVQDGLPREVLGGCRVAGDVEQFASAVLDLLGHSPADRRSLADRAELAGFDWGQRLASYVDIVGAAARSVSTPATRLSRLYSGRALA